MELKTKKEYRTRAKQIRETLDIARINVSICKQIEDFDIYKKAQKIAGFYPVNKETNLKILYKNILKKWYLPVVVDDTTMIFCSYKIGENLVKNKFGVYEPVSGKEINPKEPDIIFIPALTVDKKGYRLGYGKGYYDRFLPKLSKDCKKIVLIPDELVVENLPYDKFDIPVDIAITQSKIYKFNP